jgi:hypothetical protein
MGAGTSKANPNEWGEERATRAAFKSLRQVPDATAVQVGAFRVQKGEKHAALIRASTPPPPPGHITWLLFVQSRPDQLTYFDSFEVYVEERSTSRPPPSQPPPSQPSHAIVRACEGMALTLYPRWAKAGAQVHLLSRSLPPGRRGPVAPKVSWVVTSGAVRPLKSK